MANEYLKTYLNLKNIYNLVLRQNNKHTKFGISAHDLRIEKGRYEGLKVEDRICNTCNLNIEDEFHFLMICSSLDNCIEQTILIL